MRWEYTQLRFVPRGKSWTGEIEELWLDDRQLISRGHPQRDVTLVGLMNELGEQGWELVTYAQPFTGYHGGCYTFGRSEPLVQRMLALMCCAIPIKPITSRATATVEATDASPICV